MGLFFARWHGVPTCGDRLLSSVAYGQDLRQCDGTECPPAAMARERTDIQGDRL
ncbi:MAG: hypothetical protein KME57_14495 [Scytonema hyalinum WJT4-NPBG1]|nr:hypothetical protein [Scytonema hyalinum WJT4-NPBG1]